MFQRSYIRTNSNRQQPPKMVILRKSRSLLVLWRNFPRGEALFNVYASVGFARRQRSRRNEDAARLLRTTLNSLQQTSLCESWDCFNYWAAGRPLLIRFQNKGAFDILISDLYHTGYPYSAQCTPHTIAYTQAYAKPLISFSFDGMFDFPFRKLIVYFVLGRLNIHYKFQEKGGRIIGFCFWLPYQ